VALLVVDLNELPAIGKVINDRALLIQLCAPLIEIGNFQFGAQANDSLLWLQLTQQESQQRGLAHPVGPNDADFVPSQYRGVEVANQRAISERIGGVDGFHHQLSR